MSRSPLGYSTYTNKHTAATSVFKSRFWRQSKVPVNTQIFSWQSTESTHVLLSWSFESRSTYTQGNLLLVITEDSGEDGEITCSVSETCMREKRYHKQFSLFESRSTRSLFRYYRCDEYSKEVVKTKREILGVFEIYDREKIYVGFNWILDAGTLFCGAQRGEKQRHFEKLGGGSSTACARCSCGFPYIAAAKNARYHLERQAAQLFACAMRISIFESRVLGIHRGRERASQAMEVSNKTFEQ